MELRETGIGEMRRSEKRTFWTDVLMTQFYIRLNSISVISAPGNKKAVCNDTLFKGWKISTPAGLEPRTDEGMGDLVIIRRNRGCRERESLSTNTKLL